MQVSIPQIENPSSRRLLVRALHSISWQSYTLVQKRIPGILLHRPVQAQRLFAPYHFCLPRPFAVDQLKGGALKAMDELLKAAEGHVGTYLERHSAEIGVTGYDEKEIRERRLEPAAIEVNGAICVPSEEFSSPPTADGEQWTMHGEVRRRDKQPSFEKLDAPLFTLLARKTETDALTDEEVRALLVWIGWLREFRNSLAIYETFHRGEVAVPRAPEFQVSMDLARKLETIRSQEHELVAEEEFKKTEDGKQTQGPLTPAQLTALKIYSATVETERLPRFLPCRSGGQWCFVDGRQEVIESLNEKTVLALQDPKLKPGAYLDALIMMAKNSSVINLAVINLMLPQQLKTLELPDACRASPEEQKTTFLGDQVSDFEKVLKTFSTVSEREWWVQQVASGVQEMVFAYQMREEPLVVPPAQPRVFNFNERSGSLYQMADYFVADWARRFFEETASQLQGTNRARLLEAGKRIQEVAAQGTFADSLRYQRGQDGLADYSTLLGEKLLLLFGTIQQDLVKGLSDEKNWTQRKEVLTYLVQRAVVSAFRDRLMLYVTEYLDPRYFQLGGDEGRTFFEDAVGKGHSFWEQYFDPTWNRMLFQQGGADTLQIARDLVDKLYETDALKKSREKKWDGDSLSKGAVRERVVHSQSLIQEAAKAQETIEYMRTLVHWQNSPFNSVLPRDWNYHALASGTFPGTAPACFHVPDGTGHGYGRNTYGELNAFSESGYFHLQKGLASLASRTQEKLMKRLQAKYPDAVLKRSVGVADNKVFSRVLLKKFYEVLEARDTHDRGRVASLRLEAFQPLIDALNDTESSEKWYDERVKTLLRQTVEQEVRPILKLRPAGEDAGWQKYLAQRLQTIFETRIPLARVPETTDFLERYAKSGIEKTEAGGVHLETVARLTQQAEELKIDAKVAIEEREKNWAEICSSQPMRCDSWFGEIQDMLDSETFRAVYEVMTSVDASLGLAPMLAQRAGQPLTPAQQMTILRRGWFGEQVSATELWFGNSPPDRVWGRQLRAKIAKATPEEKAKLEPLLKKIDDLLAARKERVKAAVDALNDFIAKLPRPITQPDLQVQMRKYLVDNPARFEAWRGEMSELVAVTRALIASGDAVALGDAFESYRAILVFTLSKTTLKQVQEAFQNSAGEEFYQYLTRTYLPGYYDFRNEVLSLTKTAVAPQVDVISEMIEIEKRLEKIGDSQYLLAKKGESESKEAKIVAREKEHLEELRASAKARFDRLERLRRLLEAFAPQVPEAEGAVAALKKIEPKNEIWAQLYQDHRQMKGKNASIAELIEDLNVVARRTEDTLPASRGTARTYLEDLSAYCRAGRTDPSFSTPFEAAYEQVLSSDLFFAMGFGQGGASERVSRLARIPGSGIKRAWKNLTTRGKKMRHILEKMDRTDWKDILQKAALAGNQLDQRAWIEMAYESLPSAAEFCSHIENKADALIKELEGPAEEPTPSELRARYWDLVELASGVIHHPQQAFMPFVRHVEEDPETVWFRRGPADRVASIEKEVLKARIATPALMEFLHQRPSRELIDAVWPVEFLVQIDIDPDSPAFTVLYSDPFAWINNVSFSQRSRLYDRMEEFFRTGMSRGGAAVKSAVTHWVSPTGAIDGRNHDEWWKRLDELVAVWRTLSVELRGQQIQETDRVHQSEGAWRMFAVALVRTLMQGTRYRIDGELLKVVPKDPNGDLRRESEKRLSELAVFEPRHEGTMEKPLTEEQKKENGTRLIAQRDRDTKLQRLAQAAQNVVFTSVRRGLVEGAQTRLSATPVDELAGDVPEGALFARFYADHFLLATTQLQVGTDILEWAQHYRDSLMHGQVAYVNPVAEFKDTWMPVGRKTDQAEAFRVWVHLLEKKDAEKAFQALRAKPPESIGRSRLWERYESLDKLKRELGGDFDQIVQFFEKWDRNAQATTSDRTYPYLMALLNWNIRHYARDLNLGPSSPNQPLLESFLAFHLKDVVEEVGLPLDDFNGWKRVFDENSEPIDWLVMADSKRSILVDAGARRFYSALLDAPQVDNSYWGATYYRPFPTSEKERSQLAPDLDFPEWYAETQDPEKNALYRVSQGNRKQVELYEQMVADNLEMQGESTVNGSVATADRKGIVLRSFETGKVDWGKYFADSARAIDKTRKTELLSLIRVRYPALSEQKAMEIIQDREALVAFRRAASELMVRYGPEPKVSVRQFANLRTLERDLNALVAAYAKHTRWTGPVDRIDVSIWDPANAHHSGVAQAIYFGSIFAYGKVFLGKNSDEKSEAEGVLTLADSYYRLEAQTNSYHRGLLAVSKNIQDNLSLLCAERRLVAEITTPAQFDDAEERIWKMKLPLMDGMFKVIEELTPPGSGDEPRQMLRAMIQKAEQEREAKRKRDQQIAWASTAAVVALVLASRHPALARAAAMNPLVMERMAMGVNWGLSLYVGYNVYTDESLSETERWTLLPLVAGGAFVNRGLNESFMWWLGLHQGYQAYEGFKEDFHDAPERLAEASQVRDSQYQDPQGGFAAAPLMSDESASLRRDQAAGLLARQRSKYVWTGRIIQTALALEWAAVPTLRYLIALPRRLVNGSFRLFAGAKDKMFGGRWAATNAESELKNATLREANGGLARVGTSTKGDALGLDDAQEVIDDNLLPSLTKKLKGWEVDGQIVPSPDMKDILLADTRLQMESVARIGQIDPVRMESVVHSTSPKVAEFQANMLARLRYLKSIESKLTSSMPHVSADDVTTLLSQQGSVYARHRPWYFAIFAAPYPSLSVWRLRGIQGIVEAGTNSHHGLSFYYLQGWMKKARPSLKQLAADNPDVRKLLMDVAKGEPIPVYGEAADKLRELAPELQKILRLGGLKMDAVLADAVLAEDSKALLNLYYKLPKQLVLGVEAAKRFAPEKPPEAPPVAYVGEGPSSPAVEAAPSDALARLQSKVSKQPLKDFEPYANYLRERIPTRVGDVPIDRDRVIQLTQNYTPVDLQNASGRHLSARGFAADATTAELRLASEYRKAIEFDLAGRGWRSADGNVSGLFDELYKTHLVNAEQIAGRPLSIEEARAVLFSRGQPPLQWTSKDIQMAADHLPSSVNGEVRVEAEKILAQFSRSQRTLWKLEDVLKVVDYSPEYLKVSGGIERFGLNSPLRINTRLTHEEYMQLSQLLSKHPPNAVWEAEWALRIELSPKFAPEELANMVRARAEALTRSLHGIEGATTNVREAEKVLLQKLGF